MAHLTLKQRYEIEICLAKQMSLTEIGEHIGKNKSVICREIKRNSDLRNNEYKADLANEKTRSRHVSKPKKKYWTAEIEHYVTSQLKKDFSPEQIIGRAKLDGNSCISHERIYQFIWQDKKDNGTLYQHLRTKGKRYRKRGAYKDTRGLISGRVDIDQRPSIVDIKERIGDLEIDLVIGKNHKQALLTINDRTTGILLMDIVETKEAKEIEYKSVGLLEDWSPIIFTITSDNGKEFANHQQIAQQLNIDFYFAKPYHSWQRGANENLNGLVRQYFPKDCDFTKITKQQIIDVQTILNNRPRKRFGFKTPNEVFAQKLDNLSPVAFIT